MTAWTDEDRASWRSACTLDSMRGWWAGSDCVVVGGGPSADPMHRAGEFAPWEDLWSIAVNRAAGWFRPDFAACFEPRSDTAVWETIKDTPAFVISHRTRPHPRVILTPPKDDVEPWITGKVTMQATQRARFPHPPARLALGQGTFFAIAAALCLGFETVGVIGLDLTKTVYDRDGLRDAEAAYSALMKLAESMGRRIINLNKSSRLRSLRKGGWGEIRTKW